jgi:hypothetical protein
MALPARGSNPPYPPRPLWISVTSEVEWVALLLGAIALAIAAWDHLSDAIYLRVGPVRGKLERFEASIGGPVAQILMVWTVRNRVSWPIQVGFGFTLDGFPANAVPLIQSGEIWEELGSRPTSTQVFLPPRQPFRHTFAIKPFGMVEGTIQPQLHIYTARRFTIWGPRGQLRWEGHTLRVEVD